MDSVVTNIGPSQPLNSFLIQQTGLNTGDSQLLDFLGPSNINPESFSTIVELLNSRNLGLNDLKLYDRNGTIFPSDNNILNNTIDSSSNTSFDSNLLLTASLFAANTNDVNSNQDPTDVNTALENQLQNQTQVDTALGNPIQQQNQFNITPAAENQGNTSTPLTQAENETTANNNNLITQEQAAPTIEQNTSVNPNINPNTIVTTNATTTPTVFETTPQPPPTAAQVLLVNAAQNALGDKQVQNAMLINAQTSATAASVFVGNSIRTVTDTIGNKPTIPPVAAIESTAPVEKIQANVDDNLHKSFQQQEIAFSTSLSPPTTSKATLRLLSSIL